MTQPFRPELSRAWEGYFAQRGGEGASVPAQILPVVLLDDSSRGPYPPYRSFQAGLIASPTAGVFSRVGLQNVDRFPVGGGLLGTTGVPSSVAVVDWILVTRDGTAGGNFFATITHHNLNPMDVGTQAPAADTAPEKDPSAGATRPQLGNVNVGLRQLGAVLIGDQSGILPGVDADLLVHRVDGPWILGPGQILYIERNIVNVGHTVYFRGRYYPAP